MSILDSCSFSATPGTLVRSKAKSSTSKHNPIHFRQKYTHIHLLQGLANAGSGLGGVILSNTTRLLIDRLSVKYSLIVNGVISAGVLIPCILIMKPRLRESGARSEPLQVSWLFHRGFVWVWIWGALASMWRFYCFDTHR